MVTPKFATKYRVTSHQLRYGVRHKERWFYWLEDVEVKKRLGVEKLHKDARKLRAVNMRITCEHEGYTWTCLYRYEYSQAPRSTRLPGPYGFIRVEEMQRPSPR